MSKELYEKRKDNNLCVQCEKELPNDYHYFYCKKCRKEMKERNKKRKERLKEKNLCIRCGENKTYKNYMLCKKCKIKSDRRLKEFKQKKLNKKIEKVPKYMRKYFWERK